MLIFLRFCLFLICNKAFIRYWRNLQFYRGFRKLKECIRYTYRFLKSDSKEILFYAFSWDIETYILFEGKVATIKEEDALIAFWRKLANVWYIKTC